jgi:hypothetical protein
MKRWVVCKLELIDGNIEPAVSRFTENFRSYPPKDYAAGKWTLCQVGVKDLTAINADSACVVLPDLTLDTAFNAVPAQERMTLRSRLESFGVDLSKITVGTRMRDLIGTIGKQNQPTMNVEASDVSDF